MSLPSSTSLEREYARRQYRKPGGLYLFTADAWAAAKDPTPIFSRAWHMAAICSVLEDITARRRTQHVITLPPSTGKTMLTSVMWPAWVWATQRPNEQFLYASYDEGLLNKATEKLFNVLRSSWFIDIFGRVLPDREVPVSDFTTLHAGGRMNTSFGGAATGRHASVNVIDDPLKAKAASAPSRLEIEGAWRTIAETFASRTNDARNYVRLLTMQRLALGDPVEMAIKAGWTLTCFPMLYEVDHPNRDPLDVRTVEGEPLDVARYPLEVIEALKKSVNADGGSSWDGQYQLRPAVKGGSIINPLWMNATCRFDEVPTGLTIQSWDLSFKATSGSDFVAGQWWRAAVVNNQRFYFHLSSDPVFEHLSYVQCKREIRNRRSVWKASRCLIENKANGPALEDDLRHTMPGFIELVDPRGDKSARMMSVADEYQEGRVIHIEGPYLERWRREFPAFPRVRRDDEQDSASQAINWLRGSDLFGEAMRAVREGRV